MLIFEPFYHSPLSSQLHNAPGFPSKKYADRDRVLKEFQCSAQPETGTHFKIIREMDRVLEEAEWEKRVVGYMIPAKVE